MKDSHKWLIRSRIFFRLKENIRAKDIIVKILFSVWTLVYQSILIIEKKNPSEGSIDGLDDTSITAEAKHSFNITKSRKKILFGSTLQCG